MKRGEIFWATLPLPAGSRPVVVLTRSRGIEVRTRVTVAIITGRRRGGRYEITVGEEEGLATASVISCDELHTIPKSLLVRRLGTLAPRKVRALDAALSYALEIR